ncbi:MAG: hypothetical protein GQ526_10970 [Ardenticatenales bacterium]|nr:hypothetical protein [Ardenticatenales bacterium]
MTRRGDKVSAYDALEGLAQLSELARRPDVSGDEHGVVTLPIRDLLPDPLQARRVLPAGLRGRFLAGELAPVEALNAWRELASEDAMEGEVLEARVVRLARSLQAQEQINPITVQSVRIGDHERYMIETGERRWWAHWWLVGLEKDTRFEMIQAVVVAQASAWRQAAENLQGEPLSAVQEACQVARLVLLEGGTSPGYSLKWGESAPVVELDEGGMGYGFYRRALARRIPQGAWPLIEQATGKGTRYCQYLLGLFRLCDEALETADRAGITESQLRPLASAGATPERQQRIVRLVVQYGLGRDKVASLVGAADLDAAEANLADDHGIGLRKPRTIRSPETIVLDRLAGMSRLLDRTTRSEPSILQVVTRRVVEDGSVSDRLAEIESLHSFLGLLIQELDREVSAGPASSDTES